MAVFDIDGTLLPSSGTGISHRSIAALHAAVNAGVEVVIATGRRAAYALPILAPLSLPPETILIASNGAVTRTFDGSQTESAFISIEIARALCTELRAFDGTTVFTFDKPGHGELVLESLDRLHEKIALWVDANLDYIEEVSPLETVFDRGEAPMQGMMCGNVEQVIAAEKHLLQTPYAAQIELHRTEYIHRDLSILDILPFGCNKGTAIARLAASRGIPRAAIMAVGDNWNDLEMLRWAGQPVLMANAAPHLHEEAKLAGWQITASDIDHGAARALEHALTIRAAHTGRNQAIVV